LFSTGSGGPQRRQNDVVFATTTNVGSFSTDLLNRCLPIHLELRGSVDERRSTIGNPREEFLPANREQLTAELRGMIERWRREGCPLDTQVRHPFTRCMQTIGGILMVSGFTDFLENYSIRKTAEDPLRRGLGLLGAARPNQWFRASDWAGLAAELGLGSRVIPAADRESEKSRARGIGVVLAAHSDETFHVETDDDRLTLRLERRRRRFDEGQEPSTRYRYALLKSEPVPLDGDEPESTAAVTISPTAEDTNDTTNNKLPVEHA
jgi:hypothetical protein